MSTKTLTRDEAQDAIDLLVHDEIVSEKRWATVRDGVYKDADGKHYRIRYEQGATEYQDDHDPFGYADTVEVTEVELRPVTVEKWVEV